MTPKLHKPRQMFRGLTKFMMLACVAIGGVAQGQYTFQTLATFDGTKGVYPRGELIRDAGGNLYGTTENGGTYGYGTVFKVSAGTSTITTLATFDGTQSGSNPQAGLVTDANGNLYGTTLNGGANGLGAIFKVAAGTNQLTNLFSFDGTPHGSQPRAGLMIDAAGNLFGTAEAGGAHGFGAVFKVAAGTNAVSTVASFDAINGQNPHGGVVADSSGNLYGTTAYGGAFGYGVVFKVAAGTNKLSTLATFDGTPHGGNPEAGVVIDGQGNLYGTTYYGGAAGYGTVFKVAAGTNQFIRVASFVDTNGSNPVTGLIVDAQGNLFGTTKWDVLNNGTAFKISAGTSTISTLKLFNGSDGDEPHSGLIADAQGNLYGTTRSGGANNYGIVFKLQRKVPLVPGDYNIDGNVDAADYTVWRNSLGQLGSGLAADGYPDNKIDAGDYNVWRTQFGAGNGAGGLSIRGVPEPGLGLMLAVALMGSTVRVK